MTQAVFPTIDLHATGENIIRLRKANGLSVRELQHYFGFEEPQAIYKWQQGKCLPSVDNLYALSRLLGVSMNEILVQTSQLNLRDNGQSQDCPFHHFLNYITTVSGVTEPQSFQSIRGFCYTKLFSASRCFITFNSGKRFIRETVCESVNDDITRYRMSQSAFRLEKRKSKGYHYLRSEVY